MLNISGVEKTQESVLTHSCTTDINEHIGVSNQTTLG